MTNRTSKTVSPADLDLQGYSLSERVHGIALFQDPIRADILRFIAADYERLQQTVDLKLYSRRKLESDNEQLRTALQNLADCCGHDDDEALLAALRNAAKALSGASSPVETTEVTRLRAALGLMYDKWEDGVTCWEDGDDSGISLGNAFKLTDEEEREILSLIPSQRSAVEPAEEQT